MQMRRLGRLTWIVIAMVVIDAAICPALLLAYHLSPDFYEMHSFSDLAAAPVDLAITLWWLLTMAAFGWWVYRAGSNLAVFRYDKLEYSPAARAWWFFVPFANIIIPYLGMRELWNASHGNTDLTDTPPLIAIWWGVCLLNLFGLLIFAMLAGPLEPPAPVWVQAVTNIAMAIVTISVLLGIARAQAAQRGSALTDVFA